MYRLIYGLALRCYVLILRMAATFHTKARLWVNGRKNLIRTVKQSLGNKNKVIWFHAASLGEFEQGRPLIEAIRKKYPNKKIVLTFFSPSGYEVQKNYPGVDLVCYIPLDTKRKMKAFVQAVNPEVLFVIKYEFWFNLFKILKNRNIKIYLVSGLFRKEQHFFKWWGRWFRKELQSITWFFVQDESSQQLLKQAGFYNVSISGDTRFDRVVRIAEKNGGVQIPDFFTSHDPLVVAGSTWPQDEAQLLPIIHALHHVAWIIAPHQVEPQFVDDLMRKLPEGSIRLSEHNMQPNTRVLVVDSIGMLSKIYRFAKLAYVGGGFSKGIHNLPEAAVYGCPVVFGPNHKAFREAHELKRVGGGFAVNNTGELSEIITKLLSDQQFHQKAAEAAKEYIRKNLGATAHILDKTGY